MGTFWHSPSCSLSVMAPLNEIHRVMDEGHEASLRVGDLVEMLREPIDPSFVEARNNAIVRFTPGRPAIRVNNLVCGISSSLDGTLKRSSAAASRSTSTTAKQSAWLARPDPARSTWIKVLLRLIPPAGGQIFLDGQPLERVSAPELARIAGMSARTRSSSRGRSGTTSSTATGEVDDEHVQRAANTANLHDEIMAMPGGYNATVVERGTTSPADSGSGWLSRASCSVTIRF